MINKILFPFLWCYYECKFRLLLWGKWSHYKAILSGTMRECFVMHGNVPHPCEVQPRQRKDIDDPTNIKVRLRVMGADKRARVDGSCWSPPVDVRQTYPMSQYIKAVAKMLKIRRRLFEPKHKFHLRVDAAVLTLQATKRSGK